MPKAVEKRKSSAVEEAQEEFVPEQPQAKKTKKVAQPVAKAVAKEVVAPTKPQLKKSKKVEEVVPKEVVPEKPQANKTKKVAEVAQPQVKKSKKVEEVVPKEVAPEQSQAKIAQKAPPKVEHRKVPEENCLRLRRVPLAKTDEDFKIWCNPTALSCRSDLKSRRKLTRDCLVSFATHDEAVKALAAWNDSGNPTSNLLLPATARCVHSSSFPYSAISSVLAKIRECGDISRFTVNTYGPSAFLSVAFNKEEAAEKAVALSKPIAGHHIRFQPGFYDV